MDLNSLISLGRFQFQITMGQIHGEEFNLSLPPHSFLCCKFKCIMIPGGGIALALAYLMVVVADAPCAVFLVRQTV